MFKNIRLFVPLIPLLGLFAVFAINTTRYVQPADQQIWRERPLENTDMFIPASSEPKSGKTLYLEACAACHGADGTGAESSQLGFSTPVPDFTECNFATREPDADWIAVAHQGGPTRGFSTDMPAFGESLTEEELQKIMDHIRSFCEDDRWPRGELNLPRPLVTEKAYPEDEAVYTISFDMENEGAVNNEIVYERRFGPRNQVEIVFPFGYREQPNGTWTGGQVGDMAIGVKRTLFHSIQNGSIFSFTGEFILPTGDERSGFGKGTTVFEPFASFGQLLPAGSFVHLQTGLELPFNTDKAGEEVFWRGALGKSFNPNPWGRTWSPMVEILGSRELETGAETHWDIVPQVQVTLNTRQHIMMNVGVRIPADDPGRDTQFVVYILWDWFDGGLFEGW